MKCLRCQEEKPKYAEVINGLELEVEIKSNGKTSIDKVLLHPDDLYLCRECFEKFKQKD